MGVTWAAWRAGRSSAADRPVEWLSPGCPGSDPGERPVALRRLVRGRRLADAGILRRLCELSGVPATRRLRSLSGGSPLRTGGGAA